MTLSSFRGPDTPILTPWDFSHQGYSRRSAGTRRLSWNALCPTRRPVILTENALKNRAHSILHYSGVAARLQVSFSHQPLEVKWGVGTILEIPLERSCAGSVPSAIFSSSIGKSECSSEDLLILWQGSRGHFIQKVHTLNTRITLKITSVGTGRELTVAATRTDGLFVAGFPQRCTFMVLSQAFVWLFWRVSCTESCKLAVWCCLSTGCHTDSHLPRSDGAECVSFLCVCADEQPTNGYEFS